MVPPGEIVEVGDQGVAVEAEGADVAVKMARHLAAPYMTSANSGPLTGEPSG
jgi:hypothetical protein